MIAGFDKNSDLICRGVVGDGCGGDRFFFVKDNMLYAYDEVSGEMIKLLDGIISPQKISKKHCIITIECSGESIKFDLSQLKKI